MNLSEIVFEVNGSDYTAPAAGFVVGDAEPSGCAIRELFTSLKEAALILMTNRYQNQTNLIVGTIQHLRSLGNELFESHEFEYQKEREIFILSNGILSRSQNLYVLSLV
jgi:hypothetical protein